MSASWIGRDLRRVLFLLFSAPVVALSVLSCGDNNTGPAQPLQECTGSVTISVTAGTTPTFSWTPNCTVGGLLVEEGATDRWGAWAGGPNVLRSPIGYGVTPPGGLDEGPADALILGHTYTVILTRVISVQPESLQVLGVRDFTP